MTSSKAQSLLAPASILPRHFYRMIVDAIPHIIWTAHRDGAVDYVNGRLLEYTGMSATQLNGWGWKSVIHPDDLAACVARRKRALSSGRGFEAEYRLRRHDGTYRWHFQTVVMLRGTGGNMMWCGTCTDVEERKNTVRLLEQARQTLESIVVARTHGLEIRKAGDFPVERLSERELQVLRLIVEGRTSAEIGEELGLSSKSIDTYRSRLMGKLEIEDIAGLVKFAIRHGLTKIL